MIGDVAQDRWTLRFRDPVLERSYRDDLALQLRTQVSVILTLLLIVWVASGAFDPQVSGSDGNTRILVIGRFLIGLPPLAAAVLLHVMLRRAAYLRWRTTFVWAMNAALMVAWIVVGAALPDPDVAPVAAGAESWILGTFAFALLYGLPIVITVPTLVVADLAYLGIGAAWYPQLSASDVSNSVSGLVLAMIGAYMLERARRQTFVANARAARLLDNVLPAEIAERLKHGERRIAEQFDEATVLFADLVGFTALSAQLPASAVVDTLDEVFTGFDELAEQHGLEKIKTIGDAYMVVGGVPRRRDDHVVAAARMALAMRAQIAARADGLQIRIGIHTGPVVAGVIGKRKFIYDLWGDTVNVASRMESHGVAGEVQVSAAVAATLGGAFVLEPRGAIAIKGKGEQEAFLLVRAS